MNEEKLVNMNVACEMLGVSKETLRNWDDSGKFKAIRTEGNHRRYRLGDILDFLGIKRAKEEQSDTVAVYCRVSTYSQKTTGDLERQKGRVLEHCVKKGYKVEHILEEVRSGMNDNRPKLKTLFSLARERKIKKVVVEHKDRLTRFMFGIFEEFFSSFDVEIEVIAKKRNASFEDELVEDIVALMTSFSAKIYGKRSGQRRKKK